MSTSVKKVSKKEDQKEDQKIDQKIDQKEAQLIEIIEISNKIKNAIESTNKNLITANSNHKVVADKLVEFDNKLLQLNELGEVQKQVQLEIANIVRKLGALEKNMKTALQTINSTNISKFDELIIETNAIKKDFLSTFYLRFNKIKKLSFKLNLFYLVIFSGSMIVIILLMK